MNADQKNESPYLTKKGNMEQPNQLISTAEAAKFLGIKVIHLYRWTSISRYKNISSTVLNGRSWQAYSTI